MPFGVWYNESNNKIANNFVKICLGEIENFDLLKKCPFRNTSGHIPCQNEVSHVFKEQCWNKQILN